MDNEPIKTETRVLRRMDTPEAREFWASVDRASAEVATWPDWKKGCRRIVAFGREQQ